MEISYCSSRQKYRVEGASKVTLEKDEDGYDSDDDDEEEELNEIVVTGGMDITDTDYNYYMENFHNQPHFNLLANDNNLGVISISAIRNDGDYIIMLRTKKETKRIKIGENEVRISWIRRVFNLGPSIKNIIRAVDASLPVNRFKFTNSEEAATAVLSFDQRQIIKGIKVGLLYRSKGQVEEEEMFSNSSFFILFFFFSIKLINLLTIYFII